jgi:transposase-like protein
MSFVAIGRKYGVSDNAVRKWIRWYEEQTERERSPRGRQLEPEPQAADSPLPAERSA